MRVLQSIILALIIPFTWSCKQDFDLTEKYKDIPVVYGILSQNDTVQYIRVLRTYSGDNNPYLIAAYPDSSSYGNDIEVVIEEVNEAGGSKFMHLDTITLFNKDSGTFYSPRQLLYTVNATLNQASTYNLLIHNKVNGNEVTASTRLVHDFSLTKPSPEDTAINFRKTLATQQKFEWQSAEYGKLYKLIIEFYFKEIFAPGDTIFRKVEWPFNSIRSLTNNGGENLSVNYYNGDFYYNCNLRVPYADKVKEEAVISRKPDHISFVFTVVADDLCTYIDISNPPVGVLLDEPGFSANITNGLGVFSARYTKEYCFTIGKETQLYLWNMPNLKFLKPLG